MNVSRIMTVDVKTCRPDDSLTLAAGEMWKRDVGCLPVVDRETHVLGMITDRDICMAGYLQGRALHEMNVSTVMSREIISCSPLDSIKQVEDLMRANKVRRLPVVDSNGKLAGILSLNDIACEAEREAGTKHPDISSREVAGTLAAVGGRRTEEVLIQTI